jgi:hypothetical protein
MEKIGMYYLGFVFVIASIHRFILKKDRTEELTRFHLPKYFDTIIYVFEFIIGAILLSSLSFCIKRIALAILLVFLVVACGLMVFYHYKELLKTYFDVFTFQSTSMSFFMHLAYIVIILTVIS